MRKRGPYGFLKHLIYGLSWLFYVSIKHLKTEKEVPPELQLDGPSISPSSNGNGLDPNSSKLWPKNILETRIRMSDQESFRKGLQTQQIAPTEKTLGVLRVQKEESE